METALMIVCYRLLEGNTNVWIGLFIFLHNLFSLIADSIWGRKYNGVELILKLLYYIYAKQI